MRPDPGQQEFLPLDGLSRASETAYQSVRPVTLPDSASALNADPSSGILRSLSPCITLAACC